MSEVRTIDALSPLGIALHRSNLSSIISARNPLIRPLPEIDPVVVFGNLPPPKVTLDDLCPPPVQCKDCPDPK